MKWKKFRIKTTTEAEDIIISTLYDIGLEGAQIEDKVPLTALEKEQMFVDILPDGPEDDGIAYLSFFVEEDENGTLVMNGNPVTEEEVIRVRRKAGKAVQAVFRQLGLSPISDEQVEAVTYAHGSKDTLDRDVTADLMAAEDVLKRGITGVDVVKALAESGYEDVAMDVLNMLKQRVIGDYMQTAAILDREFHVLSGVNTPNDYMGPGTGYRVEGERWEEIKKIPHIINPQDI